MNFKHELTFLDFPITGGLREIIEPVKFDGATFTIERQKQRYAFDTSYGMDGLNLVFWDVAGRPSAPYQVPSGQIHYYLSHALPFLLQAHKERGFEANVEYTLSLNGSSFLIGRADFVPAETDGRTFFSCKFIQSGAQADMKKDADTKINILGTVDLKGNAITPAPTTNILLRAHPVSGLSTWAQKDRNFFFAGGIKYFNFARLSSPFEIKDSLIPEYDAGTSGVGGMFDFEGAVNNFRYIRAQNNLSNVKVHIDLDYTFFYRYIIGSGFDPSASFIGTVIVSPEPYIISGGANNAIYSDDFYNKTIATGLSTDFSDILSIDFSIPDVPKDYCVSVMWSVDWDTGHLGTTNAEGTPFEDFLSVVIGGFTNPLMLAALSDYGSGGGLSDRTGWLINNQSLTISATQTAFDSIIKGVREIDMYKQTNKIITGGSLTVNAPKWESGGEHYDNFCLNGKMTRGFANPEFTIDWKTQLTGLQEPNGDAMVTQTEIFIGEYPDFYTQNDIGGFLDAAPESYLTGYDEDYLLRNMTRGYDKYEQDRDEKNTNDSVHTEQQVHFPVDAPINERVVRIPFIRDFMLIESLRRQGIITKPTTSLGTDDDLIKLFCVRMAAGSFREYGAKLLVRINAEGTLSILNTSEEGEATFGWDTLGFNVGDNFYITGGNNVGTYEVIELSVSILVIRPLTVIALPVQEGDIYIVFKYFLTNVVYMSAGDENFYSVTGIDSGNVSANLDYSLGNMRRKWEAFWATVCYYSRGKNITSQFFKSNGKMRTQRTITSPIIQEDFGTLTDDTHNLAVNDLVTPILTPRTHTTQFQVGFARMLQLLSDMETIRGFIRIRDKWGVIVPVYINKLTYEWVTGTCTIIAIEKHVPDGTTIASVGGVTYINGVPYTPRADWFRISNAGYVTLYDLEDKEILPQPVLFSDILVNSTKYTDRIQFMDAMLNLLG